MDVHVDLNELQQQIAMIDSTITNLQTVCNTIRANRQKSSEMLEGNQFDIATEHINETCKKVESSISRLERLKTYLKKLYEAIEAYTKCCYGG